MRQGFFSILTSLPLHSRITFSLNAFSSSGVTLLFAERVLPGAAVDECY
jgi:hypothetical protein